MPHRRPLTLQEINQMPMEALTPKDFTSIRTSRPKFSNYSYREASRGFPPEEKERVLAKFGNENDARWYWIWVRRGLDPDKAECKVCIDNAVRMKEIRHTKALIRRNQVEKERFQGVTVVVLKQRMYDAWSLQ